MSLDTGRVKRPAARRSWRQSRLGELGQATVEHLGVIAVVVLLTTSAIVGLVSYGPVLSSKLCELASSMGLASGPCAAESTQPQAEASPEKDFRPPVCTLQTNSQNHSTKINVLFVSFGTDAGFMVAQNSDGTVTVTATNGESLGAEGGFGAKVGGKDARGATLGADVSFGAELTFGLGDTWQFDSWDEWAAMEEQLNNYLEGENAVKMNTFPYANTKNLVDPPQDPTESTTLFGISGSISAQAGARLQDGTDSDGKPKWFNPNLGAYGSGELSDQVARTVNHETNETSETYTFTTSGELGANTVISNGGISGQYQDAYKVTRNAEDEITGIQFMRETSSGSGAEIDLDSGATNAGSNNGVLKVGDEEGQRTVFTTELEVNSANRSIADEWVNSTIVAAEQGKPIYYPGNAFSPASSIDGDPLAELLHQEALSSMQVFDNVEDSWSFGLEFALGFKAGASFSGSESESKSVAAYFLGAGQSDGTRGYVSDQECVL